MDGKVALSYVAIAARDTEAAFTKQAESVEPPLAAAITKLVAASWHRFDSEIERAVRDNA